MVAIIEGLYAKHMPVCGRAKRGIACVDSHACWQLQAELQAVMFVAPEMFIVASFALTSNERFWAVAPNDIRAKANVNNFFIFVLYLFMVRKILCLLAYRMLYYWFVCGSCYGMHLLLYCQRKGLC